jgi:FkbM family methyltransferase
MSNSYSQYGEDLKILKFFGASSSGYYVDVGANNGIRDSNTALLEECGWKGLLIEANPELIEQAVNARPQSIVIHSAVVDPDNIGAIDFYQVTGDCTNLDGLSTTLKNSNFLAKISAYGGQIKALRVPANTLDRIFQDYRVPERFELLSIDVEGAELQALKGLSLDRYSPRLIVIEDNSNGADWRVADRLKEWGYQRVHRTGVNDWYVNSNDSPFFWLQKLMLGYKYLKWWLKYRIFKLR